MPYEEQFCRNEECGCRIGTGFFTSSNLGPFCCECIEIAEREVENDPSIQAAQSAADAFNSTVDWALEAAFGRKFGR